MARRNKDRTDRGSAGLEVARERVQRVLRQERRDVLRRPSDKTLERDALMSDALSRLARLRALRLHLPEVGAPGRATVREAALSVPSVEPVFTTEVDRGRQSRLSLADDVRKEHDSSLKARDGSTCKERPKDGHKRRPGSGGSRTFIPWCDRSRRR